MIDKEIIYDLIKRVDTLEALVVGLYIIFTVLVIALAVVAWQAI